MTRSRVFWLALTASLAFHLSMVTLFRIVILFERIDIPYYSLEIRDARTGRPVFTEPVGLLRLPSVEQLYAQKEAADEEDLLAPGDQTGGVLDGLSASSLDTSLNLPEIELPSLAYDALGQLQAARAAIEIRARYRDIADARPRDSWGRFSAELAEIGEALSKLAAPIASRFYGAEEEETPMAAARPAPGFVAYLEWFSEPKDRQILLAPPIDALWGMDPSVLDEPVSLTIRVNTGGEITEVLNPLKEGLVDEIGKALVNYRFDPLLDDEAPYEQLGTIVITSEGRGR